MDSIASVSYTHLIGGKNLISESFPKQVGPNNG